MSAIKSDKSVEEAVVLGSVGETYGAEQTLHVWHKLHMFPHMFEIAAARGELDEYNLDGTKRGKSTHATEVQTLELFGWRVSVDDVRAFVVANDMSAALMELLAKIARRKLPRSCTLHNVYKAKRLQKIDITSTGASQHAFMLESVSHHWPSLQSQRAIVTQFFL